MGTQYSVDQRRSLRRLGACALVLALGCRRHEAPGNERHLAPARATDAALVEANVNSDSPEQLLRKLEDRAPPCLGRRRRRTLSRRGAPSPRIVERGGAR